MKRITVTFLSVLALGLLGGVPASSARGASRARAELSQFACHPALAPSDRSVSVRAIMRPLRHTLKMELRFELIAAGRAGQPSGAVRGGDLGTWITPSDRTLGQRPKDQWELTKQVKNLAAPARYRFRVRFRWIGAHGRVIGAASRQTPFCAQPELRPDLTVSSITVQPIAGRPQRERYVVQIRNLGRTAAGSFYVRLAEGSAASGAVPATLGERSLSRLGPRSRQTLTFAGPRCATGEEAQVLVDAYNQVQEYNEQNNSLTVPCPASSGG